MVSEPQAPVSPPKDGLVSDPAPEEAQKPQETPADAPPAEPGAEQPPEGEEAGADESPYKGLSDDEVWGHETLKSRREEAESAAEKRGQSEAHRRVQPLVQRQVAELSSIDGKMQSFTDSWNELLSGGTVEAADVKSILREHRDTFAAIKGEHQRLGNQAGVQSAVMTVIGDNRELAEEFQSRIDNVFKYGADDDSFFGDLRGSIAEAETKPLKEQIKEKDLTITRLQTELKQAGREEGKPPVKPQGGGGSGGGGGYSTQREVEAAHVQGKITSAEKKALMRGLPY